MRKNNQNEINTQLSHKQNHAAMNTNVYYMQSIISSNEELIKSQTIQIRSLHQQLIDRQNQLIQIKQQFEQSTDNNQNNRIPNKSRNNIHNDNVSYNTGPVIRQQQKKCCPSQEDLRVYKQKIQQLEQQLISTKMQLAIRSSQSLQKDVTIKDLAKQNQQLGEEIQKISTFSENDVKSVNSDERNQHLDHNHAHSSINVSQQNLQEFIQPQQSVFNSFKSFIDGDIFKKVPFQNQSLNKQWEKLIDEHILPKTKLISFRSLKAHQRLAIFLKNSFQLLKKNYGIPHVYRNKVWAFITKDNLSLTNSLFIQLLDRKNRGWVCEKIKQQISKDILRSFNGEGSKEKLMKIYEIGLQKSKSIVDDSNTQSTMLRRNSLETTDVGSEGQQQVEHLESRIKSNNLQQKQDNQVNEDQFNQPQHHFRISEDATQILQMFHLYRPDIGFVQGMTYPTIILCLVTGKVNAFRILCNLLLCSDFFKCMITFEPNFVSLFCRVFDQLLLSSNLNLYNRLFKQLEIKSEVFLVDWFFTFFSRGISPLTILKVWDLLLYHLALWPKSPELIFYRLSLTILDLLEPILMKVNYEQTIRTIREYSRKLDEQQLIAKLYDSMKDEGTVRKFEEKYNKVKETILKRSTKSENAS